MSTTIDQQFVEYIVKSLVSNPDAVSIERKIDEKGVLLSLTVDEEDLGRVIGKRGAGAQALRTLLRALGTKNDARYNLKIVDVGGERPSKYDRDHVADQPEDKPAEAADEASASEAPFEEQQDEEPKAEEPAPEKVEEPESDTLSFADDDDDKDDHSSSMADKTRRELADLDDLDI